MRFSELDSSAISFTLYSAIKYNPQIRFLSINVRKRSSLLLILNSKNLYTFEQGNFTATKNSLVFLPKDGVYTSEILSNKSECLKIEFDILSNNKALSISQTPICIPFDNDISSIKRIFEKIIELYKFKPSGYTFSINEKLFKLFSLLIQNEEKNSPHPKSKIHPAITYIEINYNKKISSAYLAKLCVISESHLRRLFNDELGVSPLEYKRKIQLDNACTLLESGNHPITQIAEMLGFDTLYAFSAFFKKRMGISPKQYSKNN